MYTYNQDVKNKVRHKALRYSIEALTTNRGSTCCVKNDYVRNLYDYFYENGDGNLEKEIQKIDKGYILEWEKLQKSCVGNKRVDELTVCYLCGPEPQNDFNELISLGILPHNIWAFENDTESYNHALNSYIEDIFPKPKIVKNSIEKFFKDTPRNFDIVYIDACANITTPKKGLRLFSTLCKYHRLNSPGIVITNFSMPDISHSEILNNNVEVLAPYFLNKKEKYIALEDNESIKLEKLDNINSEVSNNFEYYYSEYISSILKDIASVTAPVQRFANSEYIRDLFDIEGIRKNRSSISDFNMLDENSIYKYFYMSKIIQGFDRLNVLNKDISGYGDEYKIDLFDSLKIKNYISKSEYIKNHSIKGTLSYIQSKRMYQFLDKPTSNLFLDVFVNQFGYPMHYTTDKIIRMQYKAKKNTMMLDIIPFDECRYIYEWLPSTEQILGAFKNVSWQYIFRFALDGLVKQRMHNNTEVFYQGSVISKNINGFEMKEMHARERM